MGMIGNTPYQGIIQTGNMQDAAVTAQKLAAAAIAEKLGYTPIAPTNNAQTTSGTAGAIHMVKEIEQFQFGGSGITDEYLLLCPHTTSTYSDAFQIMGEIFASRGGQSSGNSFDVTEVNVGRAYNQLFGSIQTKNGSSTSSFVNLVTCTYGGVRWLAAKARTGGGPAHNGIFFRGWVVGADASMFKRVRAGDISSITTWRTSGLAPNMQTGYADNVSDEFVIPIDTQWPVSVVYFTGWHNAVLANLYLQMRNASNTSIGSCEANLYAISHGNLYWTDTSLSSWQKLNPGSFDMDASLDWGGTLVVRQNHAQRSSVLVDFNHTKTTIGPSRTTGSIQYTGNALIEKIAVNADGSGTTPTLSGRWLVVGLNNYAMT